jgi:hypothetical protein
MLLFKDAILTAYFWSLKPVLQFKLGHITPHFYLGSELDQATLDSVVEFRKKSLAPHFNYLFTEGHSKKVNEDEIDQRSYHLFLKSESKIIGAIRMTPMPFEATSIAAPTPSTKGYENYLELTRMAVDKDFTHATKILLIYAGLSMHLETSYRGFVAICKRQFVKRFQLFGLEIREDNLRVPYRGDWKYYWISSSIHRMGIAVFKKKLFH